MTVRELIAELMTMPQDALVRMPDEWWMEEGYGPRAHHIELTMPRVAGAQQRDGYVEICSCDGYDFIDEDEEEDEEEDWD